MASKRGSRGRYATYLTRLRNLYHRKEVRLYTNLILTFLAIIVFAVFAIRPTAKTITELVKEIKDQKEVNQRLTTKIDNLAKAQEQYDQVIDQLYLIDQALPEAAETETLLGQLELLAQKNNCQLTSANTPGVLLKGEVAKSTKSKARKTAAQTTQPSIQEDALIKGRYQDLVSFLQDLASLRRVNEVTSFSIENSSTSGFLELRINVKAFYLETS